MELKDRMPEIEEIIKKIEEAMGMSRNKSKKIKDMENNLMEETRPMMVEKGKENIKKEKADKKEFDQMTAKALIRAKKMILETRDKTQDDFKNKAVDLTKRINEIPKKLKEMQANMIAKGLGEEKLSQARRTADRADTKLRNELSEYQRKYSDKMKELDDYEKAVDNYAIELGIKQKLDKEISRIMNKEKPAKRKKQTTAETEQAESGTEPETKAGTEQAESGTEPETKAGTEQAESGTEPETKEGTEQAESGTEPETKAGTEQAESGTEPETKVGTEQFEPGIESGVESEQSEQYEYKGKLKKIRCQDKIYTFIYEQGKDTEKIDVKPKIGFFKNIVEKIRLTRHRKEYGMTLGDVRRADASIFTRLGDEEKDIYLCYLAGETKECPFEIKYSKENRYSKALDTIKERLALEGKHEEESETGHVPGGKDLDGMFGKGFDQHDNQPVPPETDRAEGNEQPAREGEQPTTADKKGEAR